MSESNEAQKQTVSADNGSKPIDGGSTPGDASGETLQATHHSAAQFNDASITESTGTMIAGTERDAEVTNTLSNPARTPTTDDHDEDTSRVEEVEREASEHLARRAADMTMNDDTGTQNEDRTTSRKNAPALQLVTSQEEYDEKQPPRDDPQNELPEPPQGTNEPTGEEIQNIMEQFGDGMGGLGEQEIMSPRLERQSLLVLPPRSSSLEPKEKFTIHPSGSQNPISPMSPQVTGNSISLNKTRVISDDQESIRSARSASIFQPPPPTPDPDPPLPFDFNRFLEQLKHRTADPVARFLRSFFNEFGKKQWMVHEQVKIISDFLEFITKKMGQCEVWRSISDAEFENAREGMEKLVMNRLYSQTFSPAIPPMVGSPNRNRSGRSQTDSASPHGPGRRGQHQEDVERDDVIAQKIDIYGWIREEHLDIKPVGQKGRKFLALAQKQLLNIKNYRAPRDKVICVLNCCKVIFGFLKSSQSDQSADAFIPLLIYTVLQARPEHLVSNVQYIWRFRTQEKLGGEAGYYMSSLMGVVTFIENLDRTNLTITDEEFEKNVEQAVSAIAEKNKAFEYESKTRTSNTLSPTQSTNGNSSLNRPAVISRNSGDAQQQSNQRRTTSLRAVDKTIMNNDENEDTMTGLLRTIQKPLNSIGRMFSDEDAPTQLQQQSGQSSVRAAPLGSVVRGPSPRPSGDRPGDNELRQRQQLVEDTAARQASAEAAQAQRVRVREHRVVVETLESMFPNLDKEVIEDVVRAQEGNVGRAVDACLALSG